MFVEGGSTFVKKLMKKIKKQTKKMELTFPDIEKKTGVDRVVISDAIKGNTSEMKFDNFLSVASVLFENMEQRKRYLMSLSHYWKVH